jgi:conjugative transposon TraM protein
METKTHLLKLLKQRKIKWMLLLASLLIAIGLWWVKSRAKKNIPIQNKNATSGLNVELPGANLKDDKALSKLSFYEQAERDSAKRSEWIKNDPYYKQNAVQLEQERDFDGYSSSDKQLKGKGLDSYQDPNEVKVYTRLAQLNKQLNLAPTPSNNIGQENQKHTSGKNSSLNASEIDRLENMMRSMKYSAKSEDPQMQQLNTTLDKILDVQHPERVREHADKKVETKNPVTSRVSVVGNKASISTLNNLNNKISWNTSIPISTESTIAFYTIDDGYNIEQQKQNTIAAAVHETQTVINGSVVKLRLSQDINVQNQVIPIGQLVYGIASLKDERLLIQVGSLRCANMIYPVKLSVYDLDGLEGLYIPGAITRDIAKQSTDNAVQSIELMSIDRSVSAQAAAAGVNAAKSLLAKKAKQVKVTVKAGYQVLLKDQEQ